MESAGLIPAQRLVHHRPQSSREFRLYICVCVLMTVASKLAGWTHKVLRHAFDVFFSLVVKVPQVGWITQLPWGLGLKMMEKQLHLVALVHLSLVQLSWVQNLQQQTCCFICRGCFHQLGDSTPQHLKEDVYTFYEYTHNYSPKQNRSVTDNLILPLRNKTQWDPFLKYFNSFTLFCR